MSDSEWEVAAGLAGLTVEDGEVVEAQAPSHEAQPAAGNAEGSDAAGYAEDDLLCPICLHTPEYEDIALVKGCEHMYCVKCILQWVVHKDEACTCPQCKTPFSRLITYRSLDGTLHDYPMEEAVCLLRRTVWFEEHLRAQSKGKAAASPGGAPLLGGHGMEEALYDDYSRFYDEYDEDQEVEDYYFSSAAGRARIVIGNRRFGDGGYVSGGRRSARPAPAKTPSGKGKAKVGAPSTPPVHTASHKSHHSTPGSSGSSSSQLPSSYDGKGKGPGRRARRNAVRRESDFALA